MLTSALTRQERALVRKYTAETTTERESGHVCQKLPRAALVGVQRMVRAIFDLYPYFANITKETTFIQGKSLLLQQARREALCGFLPKMATNFPPAAVAPGKCLKYRKT